MATARSLEIVFKMLLKSVTMEFLCENMAEQFI
jgi:hypothetical protein